MIEFKTRLKELREVAGYSQLTFSEEMGVAQSTIGNWESGTREPNHKMTMRIADFFGVSTDYLLGRTDQRTGHIIEKPAELADLGVMSVEKLGSDALTEQEIAAIRRMLAEQNKQG